MPLLIKSLELVLQALGTDCCFLIQFINCSDHQAPSFSLTPKGKYIIGFCLGTACYVKGAQNVIDKFSEILGIKPGQTTADGLFTLDALRCIGACGIAPAVSISGTVYPKMSVDKVPAIIKELREKEGA